MARSRLGRTQIERISTVGLSLGMGTSAFRSKMSKGGPRRWVKRSFGFSTETSARVESGQVRSWERIGTAGFGRLAVNRPHRGALPQFWCSRLPLTIAAAFSWAASSTPWAISTSSSGRLYWSGLSLSDLAPNFSRRSSPTIASSRRRASPALRKAANVTSPSRGRRKVLPPEYAKPDKPRTRSIDGEDQVVLKLGRPGRGAAAPASASGGHTRISDSP